MLEKRCTWPLTLALFQFFLLSSSALSASWEDFLKSKSLSSSTQKKLKDFKVVTHANVENFDKDKKEFQKLDFFVSGSLKGKCKRKLRKISQYESYKEWISFVQASSYDDKTRQVYFAVKASPLPARFVLNFKLDRVKDVGDYTFRFDNGFLKDLQGLIEVRQFAKKNCFIYASGNWLGPHTGYPASLLELFAETVLQKGLEKLIRLGKI